MKRLLLLTMVLAFAWLSNATELPMRSNDNCLVQLSTDYRLRFTGQWGEASICNFNFTTDEYDGFKIEFNEPVPAGVNVKWMINGTAKYLGVTAGVESVVGNFFNASGSITYLGLQSTTAGAKVISVKRVLLKKKVKAVTGRQVYVSPSGAGLKDGTSTANAYAGIKAAVNDLRAGDVVNIMPGTYTSNEWDPIINLTPGGTSGTADAYITFQAYDSNNRPKIKVGGKGRWNAIKVNRNYIIIDGLELEGNNQDIDSVAAYNSAYGFSQGTNTDYNTAAQYNTNGISVGEGGKNGGFPHHVIIRNCIVHDFPGGGIGAQQADWVTFENNVVYNNAWYTMYGCSGISILTPVNSDDETGYKNIVRGNLSYNNRTKIPWWHGDKFNYSDGNGIIIDINRRADNSSTQAVIDDGAYRAKTLVTNNVCYYNGGSGIHAFNAQNVDIINNTTYHNECKYNGDYGEIFSQSGLNNRIMNNIMYAKPGGKCNNFVSNGGGMYSNNLYYVGSWGGSGTGGSGNKNADPLFVKLPTDAFDGTANLHVASNSPAIFWGARQDCMPQTDKDGVLRGLRIDAGAYQAAIGGVPAQDDDAYLCVVADGSSEDNKQLEVLGGDAIFKTNWSELGGADWKPKSTTDGRAKYVLTFVEAAPEALQLKTSFTDETSDKYQQIAGRISYTYEGAVNNPVSTFSIQRKGSTNVTYLHVYSVECVERNAYAAVGDGGKTITMQYGFMPATGAIDMTQSGWNDELSAARQVVCAGNFQGMDPATVAGAFDGLDNLWYVDMKNAANLTVSNASRTSGIFNGMDAHTVVYLPAGSTVKTGEQNFVTSDGACANLVIDETAATYMFPYAITAATLKYKRVLPASSNAYTICLPYAKTMPNGVSVYQLNSADITSGVISFKPVSRSLVANQPYMLRTKTQVTIDDTKSGVTIAATETKQGDSTFKLVGTTAGLTNEQAAAISAYVLQSEGKWRLVHTSQPSAYVPPFRAYLMASTSYANSASYAKIQTSYFEDDFTVTGISGIEGNAVNGNSVIMTIDGRRVSGTPRKGIYIENGRKVIK